MLVVSIRLRAALWCAGVTVAAMGAWTAYALKYRPVLVHSPGDWGCACGEMYIKTTMRGVWNPFRDRQPEILANSFLSKLRANNCGAGDEVCQASLPAHRVSAWKLSYREDAGDAATLYYRLTKHGAEKQFNLTGVGAIDVRKTQAGWRVIGFDSYF
jgi:hypothetical protein